MPPSVEKMLNDTENKSLVFCCVKIYHKAVVSHVTALRLIYSLKNVGAQLYHISFVSTFFVIIRQILSVTCNEQK